MAALVAFLLSPLTWMWKAFALFKLWSWFLVPAGVPRLGFVTAMSITLIVSLLTPSKVDDKETTDKDWIKAIVIALLHPAFVLFCGWILHLFTA